jgi:rhodanese-related sulfurtransferase
MHVAHFLSDAEAQWWKYHNQLVGAELVVYETYPASYAEQVKAQLLEQNPTRYDGNETQLVIDANNLLRARFVDSYPDSSTLEGAIEMVERAYGFGNQFESNPSTTSLTEFRQVNYDPDTMAEDFPGLPNDTQVIVLPKYAQMVYDTARGLADQGLPLDDAYLDHYRSLVIVLNRKTGVGFASYYFPTEDPAHLPSYP